MSQPSIKRNYIYNTLYEILAIISPLITAPYVSRIFGADGIGIYSYTHAIVTYFTMFAALGVRSYGQREIAQHRDNKVETSKLFWELELMCISTTLICLIVWLFLILLSKDYSIYYAVLSMTVLAVAFDISWFWSGYEQYRFIVIRNSIIKIVGIILLFAFIKQKSDLLLYIALIAGTGLIGNISMWSYLPKHLVHIDWKSLNIRPHYKNTLVYFVPSIATSIYTVLDKAMIGWITHDDYENGYYEQATKLVNICKTVVFSIITVMSSRMSFLFAKELHEEIKHRLQDTINYVLLIAIPIVFGLISVSSRFIPLFYGVGYEKTIPILYMMAPLLLVIGISNCLGSLYFTPSGQRARSNKAIVTGAVVNLIMNFLMIPHFHSFGATLGSLAAEITITMMYLYMASDYFDLTCVPRFAWKRVIAGAIMFSIVVLIGHVTSDNWIGLILQVLTGIVVYGTVLLLFRDEFLVGNVKKIMKKVFKKIYKT